MAARCRVAWSRGAERELSEAVAYVAQGSHAAALRLLDDALAAAASLESLALRGRVVPEVADPALREIHVHRYRLMYLVLTDSVEILAFIHTARDFRRSRRES